MTTGQTVAADPFLQTGQVFSAFERLKNSAHDELREIEKRLALVARELESG
ncbi:hypothetical protein [Effusibacillus pohliae]|uniref:hypothetical protein n=1 Tax=Effusibacillus pohliae TaxID=232270 RepID=UPI00035EAAB3|nr:hypothetical protein [Effusibacillus pohliae]